MYTLVKVILKEVLLQVIEMKSHSPVLHDLKADAHTHHAHTQPHKCTGMCLLTASAENPDTVPRIRCCVFYSSDLQIKQTNNTEIGLK